MYNFLNLINVILNVYVTILCKGQNTTGNTEYENGLCKKPCLKLLWSSWGIEGWSGNVFWSERNKVKMTLSWKRARVKPKLRRNNTARKDPKAGHIKKRWFRGKQ